VLVDVHEALLRIDLLRSVRAQQTRVGPRGVLALRGRLFHQQIRRRSLRPNLSVRMRIAGAHHRPAILEDCHGIDRRDGAELGVLLRPHVYYVGNVVDRHPCNVQIVTRREAHHAAEPAFRSGGQQAVLELLVADFREQRGVVVFKDECLRILRIARAAGALVSRAQITPRIVYRPGFCGRSGHIALPWPVQPVRRDQHPFAGKGIEPAVRERAPIIHGSALA
jgi:hypothetical protein